MPSERRKVLLAKARQWYARFERPFSSISLVAGFIFDAITLTRVDEFWENFWVIAHLAIVTACALMINLIENTGTDEENPEKLHFWLVNVMQFFFGGIFSTFLVFYFRSGTIASSWPFLLLLAAAFIANERFKRHYARLAFQLSLLFLSYYAFAIYLLPILFHEISARIFLLSGLVAVGAIGTVIGILRKFSHERFVGRAKWISRGAIAGILITINLLYFYNLIPPLPLSLKDAGIYHSLIVNSPGDYTVQSENQGFFSFLDWSEPIHIVSGDPLYAYTAIFSPTALDTNILHEWQYYDPTQNAWVTRAQISLAVSGGIGEGWRTFSMMPNVTPGSWRVNVETLQGQLIGQLRFDAVAATSEPELEEQEID